MDRFLLITFAVELRDTISTGALGVALINALNFNTNLADLITAWTKLETSLGAIARLKNYEKDTPSTHSCKKNDTTVEWSFMRALEFRGVVLHMGTLRKLVDSSSADGQNLGKPLALTDVSLCIEQGQIIAIRGRSGRYVSEHSVLHILPLAS
jgi:ATP-binding cassette subfamily C (CFTR/MRP) protein 1